MLSSTSTPYDILGAKKTDNNYNLRVAYRARIHEYNQDRLKNPRSRNITAEKFRLICRAYETLSDHDKRKKYDNSGEWISNLALQKYTLQQLAAEPELLQELKNRLKDVTLKMINSKDSQTRQTPLYCAARVCNLEAVYYLTEQGAEPDLAQRIGSSALHVSAFYGHPEIVRCLLESGADYRIKNDCENTAEDESYDNEVKQTFANLKMTPFVQTAANQLDWLKNNIDKIKHIDEQYYIQRQTLLHCASKKGYIDVVRWLVEKCSADLDIVDINLNSALHLAAYGGHDSIVEYLINRGANPLLLNKWCMTAEEEGSFHGKKITNLFESMRTRDMFRMAADGVDWWFEYYFRDKSPDTVNDNGVSLLYVACRCGKTSIAKWLLEKGANINIKLLKEPGSTPLHGAVYHGHISTVDLLLSHGADINIKNTYDTIAFDDAQTDEMKRHLQQYRTNLKDNKLLDVHLYGDGAKSGTQPLAKLQIHCNAKYSDLIEAMPASMRDQFPNFSIARRPLNFEDDKTTILSAVCRARYGTSKFVQLPLCITAHERVRYKKAGHVLRDELPASDISEFHQKFQPNCPKLTMKISRLDKSQTFTIKNLSFTYPNNCVDQDVIIDVEYIMSPDIGTVNLPGCICLFQTRYVNRYKLKNMPTVLFSGEPNAKLYNLAPLSSYWFSYRTRHTRLISIGETIHAFIRHIDIIPSLLTLPPDMFIQVVVGKLFQTRNKPIFCQCLKIREHNKTVFPHIAYHGTNIKAIESILMDGLVMPSTVVSSGLRICPPTNHIARGTKAFGVDDFSNGIFITPSIHYCSDPAYAITFTHDDQRLIPVLECTVKNNSFQSFPSTVKTYVAHEGDDINAIEWRLTNTADIEIISVLLIPVITSKTDTAKSRAKKLSDNPDSAK
ncbi:unnamed protein product [Rotaria sp. Silwood1]|nr:unnamed protein product [Rotaria sp. Silwood1]CAF3524517.1 unnamed protein product [Rotaria sp. Silwood1]CAF3542146.1 unnamed protein product [Rotaria sp. Silwood1]CAF4903849.1 unnamed protein product [Rotaria sp. Silwood1]CAF4962713.1 unnamed protein product [Rotaria sp. Silwood1]